jgi:hypothetical protein
MRKMTLIPIPFIGYFAYCLGHNVFIAHKILKSIMWLVPLIVTYGFRSNVVQNSSILIETIYLLEDGRQVEIKNVYGTRR